ncbi:MAG: Coenzyme F420-reducing hydrogenase, gamma subunit [Candidatus Methanohalarchaeum thermophilum]|uniref:Coenzyme F420-reducing hydrogenase, gamma subunit n=1 Tax=Methanohalarchaeum thermophilum TaxID=1903181 RepID=A0A1Q6DUI9_METT1|nr:MAG: Coenzyme F420-reducing hydrogenase, gamma subunit [Candidatus Methanohalarchaeum thermophilum]
MNNKLKTAIVETSHCAGCEVAIADMGESLLEMLEEKIELVYAPVFMSSRDFGEVDLALIIGSVKNDHDEEKIKETREKAEILVSFGACTNFGGIYAIGDMYGKEDQLKKAYKEVPSLKDGDIPDKDIPKITDEASPVSEYVDVDYKLPGCPPPPPLIKDFLTTLLESVK